MWRRLWLDGSELGGPPQKAAVDMLGGINLADIGRSSAAPLRRADIRLTAGNRPAQVTPERPT
jgi:hypothetical protein